VVPRIRSFRPFIGERSFFVFTHGYVVVDFSTNEIAFCMMVVSELLSFVRKNQQLPYTELCLEEKVQAKEEIK